MLLGIILTILVAVFWSIGEVSYSKVSNKYDRANIYMYTYLFRSIIYILVVLLFNRTICGTFNLEVLIPVLPIIMCDLFASMVINIAVINGKLSVVSPIMAAYPVLDIVLGYLLLNELVHPVQFVLISIICIAIVLLAMKQKKDKKAPHPVKGIIFAIIYMLLVALSTYFERSIYVTDFTVFDLYYYKSMIYLIVSVMFGVIVLVSPFKMEKPKFDIIKGCSLTPIGNILYSFALSVGTISIVAPISSLYSVITNIISRVVLKEKIKIEERICIFSIIVSTIILLILGFVL